jgi:hypothetical protein
MYKTGLVRRVRATATRVVFRSVAQFGMFGSHGTGAPKERQQGRGKMLRLVFLMSIFMMALAAKKPERTWLTGTVLDATKERRSAITGSTTTGNTTTTDERRWDEDTYLIDAGDRIYIISESIPRVGGALASVRIKKAARLIPGERCQLCLGSRRHADSGRRERTQIPYSAGQHQAQGSEVRVADSST